MAPYAIREAAAAVRRAPLLAGLSAAMVALALLVVGLFSLAAYNLQIALEAVEERVEVVAYLQDGTTAGEVDAARRQLEALPGVELVRYVDKETALRIAREELPEIGEFSSELTVNPFPASLELQLSEESRSSEAVAEIADDAANLPIVEDVRYGREWVDRLFLIRRIGAVVSAVLGSAFAVVAALIIGTAVRIAIFARRDEIQIMRLLGATHWFIRRPFLLEGAFTGMAGSLLAVFMTWVAFLTVDRYLFAIEWLPWEGIALGILAGTLFGTLASGVAIRRYLKGV